MRCQHGKPSEDCMSCPTVRDTQISRWSAFEHIELRVPTLQAALRNYEDWLRTVRESDDPTGLLTQNLQMAKDGIVATLLGMLRYANELKGTK